MMKLQRKFKLFSIHTWILTLFVILLSSIIYSFSAENILGDKMPMPFGYACSVVLSGSMEPAISVNDLVIIKKADNINVGDIVVYQKNYSLTIHRIIQKNGKQITTQGDANNMSDEPIDIGAVKGVMVGKVPFVGAIIRILKQPVIIVILLLLAVFLLKLSFRYEDDETDELDALKKEIAELLKEFNNK